jgi:hypothetical protein
MCFGYVRATGNRFIDYTDPDTGTIYGGWLLSDDEWDGFDSLWNTQPGDGSQADIWGYNYTNGSYQVIPDGSDIPIFHFHAGTDTPGDTQIVPNSSGPDQGCDSLFAEIPAVIPMCYSGFAYYMMSWLPLTVRNSPDLAPLADWRTTRCRIFDANGNETSYGFTTNPAWHMVHAIIKRKIRPRTEYSIHLVSGPDPLTSAELAYFDWESIYEAAQYYDQVLPNGNPRFSGSYAFTAQANLAAILEQILLCCRSYQQEYAGKWSLMCDKPRASVFLMTSQHLTPFTMEVDQTTLHQNATLYTANFLDLNIPVVCDVASINAPSQTATITTVEENPCANLDWLRITGNSNPALNGQRYLVQSVPGPYTILANGEYSNTGSGTGGVLGYEQMRFALRSPYIVHERAAEAAGQVAQPSAGKKTPKKLSIELDFANCTFDQVNRLLKYEVYRDLGLDQDPWQPPVQITLRAWAESVDGSGNLLKAAQCGDVITLDPSASWEFAGEYEIIERWVYPFQGDATQIVSSLQQQGVPTGKAGLGNTSDMNAGYIQLLLRTFNPDVFFDSSDQAAQSYTTLPNASLWGGPGPVNGGYTVVSDTLSANDAGTSITVTYTNVVIRPGGHTDLDYANGTITNQPYSTLLYVFVDDPHLLGGAIPLQASPNAGVLTQGVGRMFVDTITTPAQGGGGTGGNGRGGNYPPCGVLGTLMLTSEGLIPNQVLYDRWMAKSGINIWGRNGANDVPCWVEIDSMEWVKVDEIMRIKGYGLQPVECSVHTVFREQSSGEYVPAPKLVAGNSIEVQRWAPKWTTVCEAERIARRTLVLHIHLRGPQHEYVLGESKYWNHNFQKT